MTWIEPDSYIDESDTWSNETNTSANSKEIAYDEGTGNIHFLLNQPKSCDKIRIDISRSNPDAAHGKEFNIKHAAKIAHYKVIGRNTARSGWFNRKPQQQFKYLESPARLFRKQILNIVVNTIKGSIK